MQYPAKYLVGIQDFGEVIRGGCMYVDKTALMWRSHRAFRQNRRA